MTRDEQFLLDILTSARIALEHIAGQTRDDFYQDIRGQDAVIRRLEIIGEAARRVSEIAKDRYSHLPWQEMIGMRNLVIHEYDAVDLSIVWDTICDDLPPLITMLDETISSKIE